MSFSNTDTGSKPADPYVAKNTDDNLSLKDKVEDFIKFAETAKFSLLTTQTPDGKLASRAMALAGKDNGVDFIFHTNTESGKTDDIDAHSSVNIGFIVPSGEWASVSGKATIVTDRSEVEKHYSPALKAWVGDLGDGKHDGGPQDPRIGLIKIRAQSVQYNISKRSIVGATYELIKGVATGEAPNINRLRHISEAELEQYRSS